MDRILRNRTEYRDPLTNALTRHSFQPRFQEEVQRSARYKKNLSLLIIDLDHFKSVNDAFGHTRGDQILTQFTVRLKSVIRNIDVLFRYGGDEFVILCPDTTKKQAIAMGIRVMDRVRSTEFDGTPPLAISISGGVASYPEDTEDPGELFEKADFRLLEAKSLGRNRIISKDPASIHSLPFERLSRLVERDQAVEAINSFLVQLIEHSRGTLEISGVKGSGRSRSLQEAIQSAKLRGFKVLELAGIAAHRDHPYGVLGKGLQYPFNTGVSGEEIRDQGQKFLDVNRDNSLLIALDDTEESDRASLDFIREILLRNPLPVAGLVYVSNQDKPARPVNIPVPIRETVELLPLSCGGLKIWLRSLLQWEPPDSFCRWLHKETHGLPVYIKKGMEYLIKRGLLVHKSSSDWELLREYLDIHLGERIGIKSILFQHNIPSDLTEFIGRLPEVQEISRLLEEKRLITLAGPGGVGKTRLALRIASEKIGSFEDGVYCTPLSSISSKEYITSAIAESIGFSFFGNQDPKAQLINYIREKEMLLVLDNFEHLTDGAELVADILRECSDIRILATTRERLNLHGEWVFELQGMRFPQENDQEAIENFSAVKLFMQCAKRISSGFNPSDDDKDAIQRICRVVKGLPLGIELAAVWVRSLTCSEIAMEIESNLDFLETKQTNVPERHRSLRAVFEHSWNLLMEPERKVYRKLAIFRGGFTRPAAAAVADASIASITSMMDKSLVHRTQHQKYYIPEVLRQYGVEKLNEQPDAGIIRKKHAAYFKSYLHTALELQKLQKQREFLACVNFEIENIREGWDTAVEIQNEDMVREYLETLSLYYDGCGLFHEAERLIRKAYQTFVEGNATGIDMNPDLLNTRIKICSRLGHFCFQLALYAESEKLYKQSLQMSEITKNFKEQGIAYNGLGSIAVRQGRYKEAQSFHEKSLEFRRQINDRKGIAGSLNNLANVVGSLGDNKRAQILYEESLGIIREVGDRKGIAALMANLGLAYGVLGDRKKEREYLNESLSLRKELDDPSGIASSLDNLANAEQFLGNYLEAEKMHRESLKLRRRIGDRWGMALSTLNMANVLKSMDQKEEARKMFQDAINIYRSIGEKWGLALTLNNLAGLIFEMDGYETAKTYFDESHKLFSEIGDKWGINICKLNLGFVNFKEGRYPESWRYFQESLRLAQEIDSISFVLETLIGIGAWFAKSPAKNYQFSLEILGCAMNHPSLSQEARKNADQILKDILTMDIDRDLIEIWLETGRESDKEIYLQRIDEYQNDE